MSESIIKAQETPTSNLLGENFIFNIPVYQRPFSWTSDNFDELFDDISNAMENGLEQYFLGSILLQQIGKNFYDLVDGQQRVTAIVILLAVIRDRTTNADLKEKITSYIYQAEDTWKEIPEVMRITPWEELRDLFKEYVYKRDGTNQFLADFGTKIKYKDLDDPRFHIFEAIQTFNSKLTDYTNVEGLVKYLLNRVYLVYIITNTRTSAFRLFNVLNARGLPLDPSDLLKSENLGEIQDIIVRDKYARIWRNLEEELGREELSNVIAFIRTVEVREKARLGIYDEFQQIFKKGFPRGTQFIDYVNEISDVYQEKVLEADINLEDPIEKNEYKITTDLLRRFVPFSDWIPPLLAFYHTFNSDNALLLFLAKLEKKVILEWVMGYSPTERMTSLNRIIKLVDEDNDADEVVSKIELPQGADAKAAFLAKLNDSQLYSAYGGKLAKYLLLRIDKEFWELENFPGYPGTVTVEHVLPRNPPQDSEWTETFSEVDMYEWTNKLGNLVLLSGRKNSQAQNYDFDDKKQIYFGQKGTAFKITQQLESYPSWNLATLKSRHAQLVGVAEKVLLG
jgi:hypothetical protein